MNYISTNPTNNPDSAGLITTTLFQRLALDTPDKQNTVTQFQWLEIDNSTQEIDYIKAFQEVHKKAPLDYQALDLHNLDPNYVEPTCYRGNVIDRLSKSIAKDGLLKTKKKAQDDYDVNDAFVDDSEHVNPTMATMHQLTPNFDDFICIEGDIMQFKKSKYFEQRYKIAVKNKLEAKKQGDSEAKTAKKSGKQGNKKRPAASDGLSIKRPVEELKKVKKNPVEDETPRMHTIVNS